jgi:hypothetical protein
MSLSVMPEDGNAERRAEMNQRLYDEMEDDKIVVTSNDTSKLSPTSMSKRQLKRVKKREKWLERKIEKRLGISNVTWTNFAAWEVS